MKFVCLLVSAVCISVIKASFNQEWTDILRTLRQECKNETHVDEGSYLEARKTGHVDRSNKKLMQFIYCILKNTPFMDEEGNINMDICKYHLVKVGVKEEEAEAINQLCAALRTPKTSKDLPLLTSEYYECYHKYIPKEIIASEFK